MKKSILILLAFFTIAAGAGNTEIPLTDWKALYLQDGCFENGLLSGIPYNRGAAFSRKITSIEIPADTKQLRISGSGFELKDLSLSLRGDDRVTVKRGAHRPDGSIVFRFSELPKNLNEIRIYVNSKGRLNGKNVKMKFDKIVFEPEDHYQEIIIPCTEERKELPLTEWTVIYLEEGQVENGLVTGIPYNRGAALSKSVTVADIPVAARIARIYGSGFDAGDLALSLRGVTNVTVNKGIRKPDGSIVFSFAEVPEKLKSVRIYINSAGRLNGKNVKMKFDKIIFEMDHVYQADKSIKRKRMFKETVIFPRIQSKYDLMKNYLSSYSSGTGTFVDRPLFFNRELADDPLPEYDKQNSIKGFQKQLQVARMFTSGLGIFYAARAVRYMNPIRAAEAAGLKNSVFMEAVPTAMEKTQMMFDAIDSTMKSSATFKHDGRLIISSYHGELYSPGKWKKILAPYRARYQDKLMVSIEMRGTGYSMNSHYRKTGGRPSKEFTENIKDRIRAYLEVADGVNFSASNHLNDQKKGFPNNVFSAEAYENYIIPVFVSVLAEERFNGKKILGLSAHRGYVQTRHTASNIDDEGTASMRKSLNAALNANPDFIVMPEWNEINENTHVEPLVSNALTNARVINATRHVPMKDVERIFPNIILSFRQENDFAFPIPIELLGLPDAAGGASKVTLHLLAPDGRRVKSFPAVQFSHQTIEESFHLEPAGQFASFRYLMPELEIEWQGRKQVIRSGLPHIRLAGAPNVNKCYVKIPLRDLPDPEKIQVRIQFDNDRVSASGRAVSADEIMSLELLADNQVLAAVDPRREYAVPEGMKMIRWMRMTPVVTGTGNDTIMLRAVNGRIQLRTPHIFSLTGMKPAQPEKNIISGRIGGGCCIREFFFFATPDAVLEVSSRKQKHTVAIRDILNHQRIRITGSHGISQFMEHCIRQIEMPFPIRKKKLDFTLDALREKDPNAVYSVRIVTASGRVYRSLPSMLPAVASGGNIHFPVWNALEDRREVLTVPLNRTRETVYKFSPERGDILSSVSESRFEDAMLGGFDYRTHSAPGWNVLHKPHWRNEQGKWVLDFKPGCGLLLCQPLFSRSAFSIDLTVNFAHTGDQTLLDIIGSKLPVQLKNGKLSGKIVTSKGESQWNSTTEIIKGKDYRLSIRYDLQTLDIWLDGQRIASVSACGRFIDGWVLCIGGAPVNAKRKANQFERDPAAGDIPDPGFNFCGTLKALRIANYPGPVTR